MSLNLQVTKIEAVKKEVASSPDWKLMPTEKYA